MTSKHIRGIADFLAVWSFLGIGFTWYLSQLVDEPESAVEVFLPLVVLLSSVAAFFFLVYLTRRIVKEVPMDPKRWWRLRLRCLFLGPIGCAMTVHELTKEKELGQDQE